MSDPFAPTQQVPASYSKLGYSVMDAPDLALRKAQIKVQQGQALTETEIHRLAQRQGLEQEALKQSFRAGAGFQGVPVSVNQGLAGTRLDPVLADARVRQAQLALDPVAQAQLAQQAELESYGIRATPGTPEAADALTNAKVRESVALQTGQPVEAVDASLQQVSIPPLLAAPAPTSPAEPPVVDQTAEEPLTPMDRIRASIPVELNPTGETRDQVAARELQRRVGGRTVTLSELRNTRAKVLEDTLPIKQTRVITDPLTRDVYEVEVETDKFGNIYSRSEPVFKSAGPGKKVDEEFQKDFNEWTTGGAAQTKTNIQQLQEAIQILRDPDTVAASGGITSMVPEWARSRLASDRSFSVKARIENVVQQSLRQILGGQFAQKEAEQLLTRAFDLRLSEEENARRAEVVLQTLSQMAAAKDAAAEYYRKHGTIQGFTGPTNFTMKDVEGALSNGGGAPEKTEGFSKAAEEYLSQF